MPSDGASPDLSSRYTRDADFVFRRLADEIILVPIRRNMGDLESIYSLNATAARIWELLDGEHSLAEIRDVLVSEFEVRPETAAVDVQTMVEQLEEAGAIQPRRS